MNERTSDLFAGPGSPLETEQGLVFRPKFDRDGLIGAIVTDAKTGEVLMFAHMNADALAATIQTKRAHFWSRSRKRLWVKGEESGNVLNVVEARVDCDQDAIWLRVHVGGQGVACHTGQQSCFYRSVPLGTPADGPLGLVRVTPIQKPGKG